MHSIVTLRDVSFEFPNGRDVFNHLNFSLDTGLTALVGANGVGKTTLAKLLSGELQPTTGEIRKVGALTFFPQREEPRAISVADFLERAWSWESDVLLKNVDRQSLCSTLSGGEWMRVRLSRHLDGGYLILDEPTNDLDRTGRGALLEFLRARNGGALIISHDRECLQLCDHVLELSNRGLSRFGGGWSGYTDAKERERKMRGQSLERAKRERAAAADERNLQRAQQDKRNRRGVAAALKGGMQKILIGARKRRAQVTTGRIDAETFERANEAVRDAHAALSEIKVEPVMYAKLFGNEIPAQKLIAEAKGFNIRFRNWIYREDLNFSWRGAIRLGLKGGNGSGKSILVKSILGENFETRGELRAGSFAALYIDQRCASLDENRSVIENVRDSTSLSESEIRSGLARFLFTKEMVFQRVCDLSGGERLRAALAQGFLRTVSPELLVLDEPTNNLDLVNVEFLENLVREFRGALIVISHDDAFLKKCGVEQEFDVTGF